MLLRLYYDGSDEVGSEWRCLLRLSLQTLGENIDALALSFKANVFKLELSNPVAFSIIRLVNLGKLKVLL